MKTENTDLSEVIEIVMEGPDGEKEYFLQDIIIPYGDNEFAVLIPVSGEDENAILTKIEQDENGETVYVSPEEEEFREVLKIYEEMFE